MKKDVIVGHIEGVPVHKDCDFQNNYVKVLNWLIKYKKFELGQTAKKERVASILTDELIEEFEEWCEHHSVTPICIL